MIYSILDGKFVSADLFPKSKSDVKWCSIDSLGIEYHSLLEDDRRYRFCYDGKPVFADFSITNVLGEKSPSGDFLFYLI